MFESHEPLDDGFHSFKYWAVEVSITEAVDRLSEARWRDCLKTEAAKSWREVRGLAGLVLLGQNVAEFLNLDQ